MTKQQLIEDNMKLVHFIVNKYYPHHNYDEDIIQCGMVGLCKAADTYDETKSMFSTYAGNCIRREIQREFRNRNKQPKTLSLDYVYERGEDSVSLKDLLIGDETVDYVDTDYFYDQLTPIQQQIFDMKQLGLSNEDIGGKLSLSRDYVAQHVRVIRSKWDKHMGDC